MPVICHGPSVLAPELIKQTPGPGTRHEGGLGHSRMFPLKACMESSRQDSLGMAMAAVPRHDLLRGAGCAWLEPRMLQQLCCTRPIVRILLKGLHRRRKGDQLFALSRHISARCPRTVLRALLCLHIQPGFSQCIAVHLHAVTQNGRDAGCLWSKQPAHTAAAAQQTHANGEAS